MSPLSRPLPYLLPGALCAVMIARAQDAHLPADTLQIESNVRLEYAEVLRVEPVPTPVIQPAHTAHCQPLPSPAPAAALPATTRAQTTASDPMVALNTPPARPPSAAQPAINASAQTSSPETALPEIECPPAQDGEVGQGVVYDVDYVLRGIKYRSRLPYDPGNRLQVQILVTPVPPSARPEPESPD